MTTPLPFEIIEPPQVTGQVLHWRGLDRTRDCLRSLKAVDYPNFRILVVDNGSESGDHKAIKEEFPDVDVLVLDRNYGFAGGSNRGLEHAMKQGADYVWLINNDATVEPNALSLMLQAAAAAPQMGAMGALVFEGQDTTAVGVGVINNVKAKTYLQKLPQATPGQPGAESHKCVWLSGSNLLLKSSALQKVGLFDERYYLYFEDVDLCLRLNRAGFDCLLVPAAIVHHQGNASTQGGLSLWRAYYHTRNRLLFFMQNAPAASRPLAMFAILGHFLRHCISLPLKGKGGRAKLYAEWLGLVDYFGGKLGRAECLDWCEKVQL